MKSIIQIIICLFITSVKAQDINNDTIGQINGRWSYCGKEPITDFFDLVKAKVDTVYTISLFTDEHCDSLEIFTYNFSMDGNLYSTYSSGYSRKGTALAGIYIGDTKSIDWRGRKWSVDHPNKMLKILYPDNSTITFWYHFSLKELKLTKLDER